MDTNFPRVNKLPPYVFDEIQTLKAAARKRGEDIIDFGMGNPDQSTPNEIVEKLREASLDGSTHRYSQSKGIPRLRKSICDWYERNYQVELDPESEAFAGSSRLLISPLIFLLYVSANLTCPVGTSTIL